MKWSFLRILCHWRQLRLAIDLPDGVIAAGLTGSSGGAYRAPWWLYNDGTLVVRSGFINSGSSSPWITYSSFINRIVFTGTITAGTSLF